MNRSHRALRRRVPSALLGVALLLTASTGGLIAGGTRNWTETAESLSLGEADGVAISLDGTLFPAPRVGRLGDHSSLGGARQIWSVVADSAGNLYLGTGPEGRILKIAPSGARSSLAQLDEPLVTALAIDADGTLLAGASPGGRVYRVMTSGAVDLFAETEEQYVWSLAVARDGAIYAGTGERGRVQRIGSSGRTEPFFDSDESHVMTLLPIDGGGILAGGAGRGLLYEIDNDGNAVVHHAGELPEVTSVLLEPDGSIVAAWLAPPDHEKKSPALRITLPDGTQVGSTDETVGALEERSGPVLRGTIEGLPEGARPEETRKRGMVLRIRPDGRTEELWSSSDEAPFCLARDSRGRIVLGVGEPARLYGIGPDGRVALLETLDESQVTALVRTGRALVAATSNPAATYRVDRDAAESGVFTSSPIDAGATARWGAIGWSKSGEEGRVEFYTRTGNSAAPDQTWSAWSPALSDPAGSGIVNPDGRYLQWRTRFVHAGAPESGPRLFAVSVSYEPYNRTPRVRDFEVEGKTGATAGEALFTWSASDPDGDPVELELAYRPSGAEAWATGPWALTGGGRGWHEGRLAWDTSVLAEGPYEVQARVSDRAANDPGEAREITLDPPLRVVVDRSPPTLEIRPADGGGYEVVVSDAHTAILRLELLRGERVIASPRPVDGLCDSLEEHFRVMPPADGGTITLRGADAAGNQAKQTISTP